MIKMHPVESSNIFAIGYDEAKKQLHIRFHKNGEPYPLKYIYDEVPKEIYDGMKVAESKGKFFRANILKAFNFDKVPVED